MENSDFEKAKLPITACDLLRTLNGLNQALGVNESISITGYNYPNEVVCLVKTSTCTFDYTIDLAILRQFIGNTLEFTSILHNTICNIRDQERDLIKE